MGDLPLPNPAPEWISERMWGEVCRASALGASDTWADLAEHVAANTEAWKRIYDSLEPHTEQLPEPWHSRLDAFQRIIVLRTLRWAGWGVGRMGPPAAAGVGVGMVAGAGEVGRLWRRAWVWVRVRAGASLCCAR